MTSRSVEELNDRLAREHPINDYYDRSPWPIRKIEAERLRIIREMVAEGDGMRILEVGSGGGHVLKMFRRSRLVACDVSDVFLDTARKNLEGYDVEFVKGEIQDLDLPAGRFDRIICTEVLEHTFHPDSILQEIARLLTENGRAIITVPNDPLINRLKRALRVTPVGWLLRRQINWGGDHYHLHEWSPHQFREYLSEFFDVVEQRSAPFDWLPLRTCFRCRRH